MPHKRTICFITGSRAEFGLMRSTLEAIRQHPHLHLRLIVTGMHLSKEHGRSIERVVEDFRVDAVAPWRGASQAAAFGSAVAGIDKALARLKPDIVLIVGDRVEALAAATAAHLRGIAIAHVHGGDRALGQIDDSLRHAITKLSHIHFPATAASAQRLLRLGEDRWRIHRVGSPGIDGIARAAEDFPGVDPRRFALLVLHPMEADEQTEFRRARLIADALLRSGIEQIVVVYPNNDPGYRGIIRQWRQRQDDPRFTICKDLPRPQFLGLLRDAAMLVGNSSSGIIEAASFRTPVIDIGDRQKGRQRCKDVRNVPYESGAIARAAARIWRHGRPIRGRCRNLYGDGRTAGKIAAILAQTPLNARLLRKIIAY